MNLHRARLCYENTRFSATVPNALQSTKRRIRACVSSVVALFLNAYCKLGWMSCWKLNGKSRLEFFLCLYWKSWDFWGSSWYFGYSKYLKIMLTDSNCQQVALASRNLFFHFLSLNHVSLQKAWRCFLLITSSNFSDI